MSSLVILAAAVFEISCGTTDKQTDRQTQRQTNTAKNATSATIVGVGNDKANNTVQKQGVAITGRSTSGPPSRAAPWWVTLRRRGVLQTTDDDRRRLTLTSKTILLHTLSIHLYLYRRVDGFKSPAGWLPVHLDQLRAQRSVTSMGSLYLFTLCVGGPVITVWEV